MFVIFQGGGEGPDPLTPPSGSVHERHDMTEKLFNGMKSINVYRVKACLDGMILSA